MRTLLMILLIATPTLAQTRADVGWRVIEQGGNLKHQPSMGFASGNAMVMEVYAEPLLTSVWAIASSDLFSANEDGVAMDSETVWYSLTFVGNKAETTKHKWKIESRIHGWGIATTFVALHGGCWADSLEIVKISGDHNNEGTGTLAVSDTGGASFSIGVPAGLSVRVGKTTRSRGTDSYRVDKEVASAGDGMVCRVRVDSWAKAHVAAKTLIGSAGSSAWGRLRADLVMTGSCVWKGIRYTDTFSTAEGPEETRTTTEPPTGGFGHEDGVPTDQPTDEERSGTGESLPEKDADDLPATGGEATPDPEEEEGEQPTEDGGEEAGPVPGGESPIPEEQIPH